MQENFQPLSWDKLKLALTKLTNNKAPGLNKLPPNSFKSLNNGNLTHLLDFFNKYWIEETDPDECNKVPIMPVPKSGDLSDPKKWNGVTLKHIGENIFSSILCGR